MYWKEAMVLIQTPRKGNTKESALLPLVDRPISQPSLDISPIWTLHMAAKSQNYSSIHCRLSGKVVFICWYYAEDRFCGLVVRVPGYRTEMYCVSCEVRTEFIYVM
jgi:hypothetical protein